MCKVSLIIPTFNSQNTLVVCLESIVNQTFKHFEIWLIDGQSNDSTLDIIQQYCKKFDFIHFISEKDNGIYDAMNKGIDLAKGEWLYFLGSDDELFNHTVLDVVFNKFSDVSLNSDFIYGNVLWNNEYYIYDGKFDINKLFYRNICHQAIFVKKDIFKKIGYFETKYSVFADYYFNCLCFFNQSIRKNYLNVLVAKFTLGGASSMATDKFDKEKLKFFKSNLYNLPLYERVNLKIKLFPRVSFLQKINHYILIIISIWIYSLKLLKEKEKFDFHVQT